MTRSKYKIGIENIYNVFYNIRTIIIFSNNPEPVIF